MTGSMLSVEMEDTAKGRLLRLAGVIDVHTSDVLAAATADIDVGADEVLLVDIAKVEFLDSSGLRVLVSLNQRLHAAGGSLRLRDPQPPVARVLEITGLNELLLDESSS